MYAAWHGVHRPCCEEAGTCSAEKLALSLSAATVCPGYLKLACQNYRAEGAHKAWQLIAYGRASTNMDERQVEDPDLLSALTSAAPRNTSNLRLLCVARELTTTTDFAETAKEN